MSEFDELMSARLRAADPVVGAPYVHANLDATLSRITTMPRVAKVSLAKGFKVKMASAAAAAMLVTSGGIAVLSAAAPSVPVLALGATTHAAAPDTAVRGQLPVGEELMMPDVTLVAGSQLTTGTTSAPVYEFTTPSDLTAASQSIASDFGVTGDPSVTPSTDGSWTIGSSADGYVDFWVDGSLLVWNYTEPGTDGGVVSSPPATNATDGLQSTTSGYPDDAANAKAAQLLANLHLTGSFGAPSFSSDDATPAGETTTVQWTTVTVPWVVQGQDSGYSFSFTFDPAGTLVSANGVAGDVTTAGVYAVVSEETAANELATSFSKRSGPVVSPLDTTPSTTTGTASGSTVTPETSPSGVTSSTTAPSGATGSTPSTGTIPTTNEPGATLPQVVTLVSATLGYGEYTLSDGTSALLPQYTFTGDDGGTYTQMALDPSDVTLAPTPQVLFSPAR